MGISFSWLYKAFFLNNAFDLLCVGTLRFATSAEQEANESITKRNTSVSWHKQRNKYRAQIRIDGKCKQLGYFDTAEEASNAWSGRILTGRENAQTGISTQQNEQALWKIPIIPLFVAHRK